MDVKPDQGNANKGTKKGAKALRDSLKRNGAARSVVAVRDGTLMAGNKTAAEAERQGIPLKFVHTDGSELVVVVRDDIPDADDPKARSIAYDDNRVGEVNLAWDLPQIQQDWESGVDLGQHWNQHELDALIADFADLAPRGDAEDFDDIPDELPEEYPSAFGLKVDMLFDSNEPYGLPPLRSDMLADLPEPIKTWAGADASADPEWNGWWLYNYGSDSIRGLDLPRSVMAFYVDDYRFENWFTAPDRYVTRMLRAGVTMAVMPNFSLYLHWPKALHIYNAYQARWLARYMQEAGVKVIPDLIWADENSHDYSFASIPKYPPCVAFQAQTFTKSGGHGKNINRAGVECWLDRIAPESVIVYGAGKEARMFYAGLFPDDLKVVWIESRAQIRGAKVMTKGIDTRR